MSIKEGTKSFIVWIKEQINWFKSFFQDKETGKANISSILKLIVILAWAQSYIKATNLMKSDGIPPITWEWIIFLSAIIGLTQIADLVKKFLEKKQGGQ
jgi:hypothetical protein